MASNFPTSIDALTNPVDTDIVTSPSHADQHANANDAIEALEAKVGVNDSAVTTSHDYKLSAVIGSNKAETQGNKDATGGYAGLTLFKINFKNALNTITSFFTNANTVARTYTFQDRDGTIADDTDLSLKAPLASPTFTGTVTLPVALTGVIRADTGVVSVDTDVTDIVSAASDILAGKVELATDAETVTGTDTARATTPANITAKMSAPGAIGDTTPGTGKFTTVETTGNIELGHATDTTLSRLSAGVMGIEGQTVHTSGRANNFGAFTAYFTETDNGNSSTADTIDWGLSNKQKSTLTGNCTFTFTAPAGPCSLILKLVQDATGSRTVTWPATVHWSGGTAPTLTTTASKVDIISFYYDGTTFFGNSTLNFTA